jgi:hypothetical protein
LAVHFFPCWLASLLFSFGAEPCFVPPPRDASTGTEKIEQRQARYENAKDEKDKESNDDPQFIKDLLAVHDKYLGVVSGHVGAVVITYACGGCLQRTL